MFELAEFDPETENAEDAQFSSAEKMKATAEYIMDRIRNLKKGKYDWAEILMVFSFLFFKNPIDSFTKTCP